MVSICGRDTSYRFTREMAGSLNIIVVGFPSPRWFESLIMLNQVIPQIKGNNFLILSYLISLALYYAILRVSGSHRKTHVANIA